RERPRCRGAADRYDELHSITSSASASTVAGSSKSSVFAVLRLTTSSNLLACTTANSPGLATTENAARINARQPISIGVICAITHETAAHGEFARVENGRNSVSGSQHDTPVALKERIRCHRHPRRLFVFDQGCERLIKILLLAHVQDQQWLIDTARGRLQFWKLHAGVRTVRIAEHRDQSSRRKERAQQFQALGLNARRHQIHPRDVAARGG